MKYKVGDVVKIRSDMKIYKSYGSDVYCESMSEFAGKTVTITHESESGRKYYICEDKGQWRWTDEMFEEPKRNMMNNEIRIVLVKHKSDPRSFLFQSDFPIANGAKVIIDTKFGNTSATVVKCVNVNENSIEDIAKLHTATLPLKKVILIYKD